MASLHAPFHRVSEYLILSFVRGVNQNIHPSHGNLNRARAPEQAVLHFVAFSKSVKGTAVVAGAPYGCNLRHVSCPHRHPQLRTALVGQLPAQPWQRLPPRFAQAEHMRDARGRGMGSNWSTQNGMLARRAPWIGLGALRVCRLTLVCEGHRVSLFFGFGSADE